MHVCFQNQVPPAPHYQSLDTATTDYLCVYTTPTSATRRVEVEDKMYSIVNPNTREDLHYYTTTH